MKRKSAITVQPWSGRWPAADQTEIANRLCSRADFWGTGLQAGHPRRGPDKAFRNPAPCAVATPDLPANRARYSSRAVEVSSQGLPATNPFFCAIFALASRSNSFEALSPLKTVAGMRENNVFTYTHCHEKIIYFPACAGLGALNKVLSTLGE